MRLIKSAIQSSRFAKNASILAGGTVVAQLIGILALPLLTRLYSPDDFEVFATFVAILSVVSVIACLRLEIAIPVPKEDETGITLVVLSLLSTLCVSAITAVAVIAIPDVFVRWTDESLRNYLWCLPLGVLFSGCFAAFQYWSTRKKAFKRVAKTRVVQSTSAIATQIACGLASITPLGLVLGQLLQSGSGALNLGKKFSQEARMTLVGLKTSDLKRVFSEYIRYPKYSTWEALTNTAAVHVSLILIAVNTVSAEAGYLFLIMKLLSAPMGLVGSSVAQVYLSEAPEKYYQGDLNRFTRKTALNLFKLGFFPLALVAFGAPFFVPIVFGQEWSRAGELMVWLAPMYLLQFTVSPISMALHITNSQKIALWLQIFGFFLRCGGVLCAIAFLDQWVVEAYAVLGWVFYCIYLVTVLVVVRLEFNS